MKESTIELLRSPILGGPLALEVLDRTGDDILQGRLHDAQSGVWFRIDDGIADLVPLALRSAERYASFDARHGGRAFPIGDRLGIVESVEDQRKQIAFFDRYHEKYEDEVVRSPYYAALDEITFGEWARRSVRPSERVLEIGCGSGRQTLPLTERGANVVAVDLSESMLSLARRKLTAGGRAAQADFVAASAENLPIADDSFDACVIFGSLHHFADPPAVLRKAAAVLRPGGRFYLLEPHNSPVRFIFDWLMRVRPLWEEEAADEPLFDEPQFRGWLEPHQIECRVKLSTYLPPHLFYGVGAKAGRRILSLSDRFFSAIPGIRRLAGVIIVEGTKPAREMP
jgi:ubiquinone/menaquinone biosynthesis C-methylase UbiE/uncharacterized protein YbaR (Trm112 family)